MKISLPHDPAAHLVSISMARMWVIDVNAFDAFAFAANGDILLSVDEPVDSMVWIKLMMLMLSALSRHPWVKHCWQLHLYLSKRLLLA